MVLHEILRALERIEEKLERIAPSSGPSGHDPTEGKAKAEDEWIQLGLTNILGYEAGKKQEGRE